VLQHRDRGVERHRELTEDRSCLRERRLDSGHVATTGREPRRKPDLLGLERRRPLERPHVLPLAKQCRDPTEVVEIEGGLGCLDEREGDLVVGAEHLARTEARGGSREGFARSGLRT